LRRPHAERSSEPIDAGGTQTRRSGAAVVAQPSSELTLKLLPKAPYEAAYTATAALIGFAFESQSGDHAFGCDKRVDFLRLPNTLSLVPAGCDVFSRSSEGGEYLLIELRGSTEPASRLVNDVMSSAAIGIAGELRRLLLTCSRDHVATEGLALSLVEALRDATEPPPAVGRRGWMDRQRLVFIDELIVSRLAGPLSVREMAGAVGVSPGFFIRQFKGYVGRTPHDYLVEHRLSRARQLLVRSRDSIAGVAADCGFASQAHMTECFRRRFGLSPGQVRRGSKMSADDERPISWDTNR
jgi:AraC family transcriptional regulator